MSFHNHRNSPWLRSNSSRYDPTVFKNSPLRECITFSPEEETEPLPPSSSSINVTALDTSSCSISKAMNMGKQGSYKSSSSQFSNLNLPGNNRVYQSSPGSNKWENYTGGKQYYDDMDTDEYSSDDEEIAINNLIKIQSSQIFSTPSFNQTLSKLFTKGGSKNSVTTSQTSLNNDNQHHSGNNINQVHASSSSMSLNLNEMLKAAAVQLRNLKSKKIEDPSNLYNGNHSNGSTRNVSIPPVLSGEKLSIVSEELSQLHSTSQLSSSSQIQKPQSAKSPYSRRSYTMSEVNLSRLLITKSEVYQPSKMAEKHHLTAHSQPDLASKPSTNNVVDWLQGKLYKSNLNGMYRKRTSSVGLDLGEDYKSKSNIGSIDNIDLFGLEKGERGLEKPSAIRSKVGSFTDFLSQLKPAKLSLMSKIHLEDSPGNPIILTKDHSMFSNNDIILMGDEKARNILFEKPAKWYTLRYWTRGDDKTERLYFIIFGLGFLFFPVWLFAYIAICLLPKQSSQTPNPMHTRWKSRYRLAFTIALWISLLIALILVITHPNWFPKHNKVGLFGNVSTMGWDDNVLKDRIVVSDQGVKVNSKHH